MNTSNKDDNSIQTISIKNNPQYLKEYITFCYLEWSNKNMPIEQYLEYKTNKILQDNISITYDLFPIVLGLFNKIGVHISKKNLNGIIISLCSSKLKSKISGELELKS